MISLRTVMPLYLFVSMCFSQARLTLSPEVSDVQSPPGRLACSLRFRPCERISLRLRRPQRYTAVQPLIGAVAERPFARRWLVTTAALALGLTLGIGAASPAATQDTIKVGILHSLSGTMAISETTLKDVMLMLIDEQNKKGG